MLPERTTTMGEEESVATERPFQHEGGGEDEGEVEDLSGELPGLHAGEGAEHFCVCVVLVLCWVVFGCGSGVVCGSGRNFLFDRLAGG
jgi:hypothetical protein